MYAVTSIWLLSRTRATLRSAEFGFLGVVVYTRVHTPRRWGLPFSAGVFVFVVFAWRPLRTNCWIVGTGFLSPFGLAAAPSSFRAARSVVVPVAGPARRSRGVVRTPRRPPRSGVSPDPQGPTRSVTHRVDVRCRSVDLNPGGRTHELPGKAGHEGKEYPPCGRRSKRVPRICNRQV